MESKFKLTVTKNGCHSHGTPNYKVCKAPKLASLWAKRAKKAAAWAAKNKENN